MKDQSECHSIWERIKTSMRDFLRQLHPKVLACHILVGLDRAFTWLEHWGGYLLSALRRIVMWAWRFLIEVLRHILRWIRRAWQFLVLLVRYIVMLIQRIGRFLVALVRRRWRGGISSLLKTLRALWDLVKALWHAKWGLLGLAALLAICIFGISFLLISLRSNLPPCPVGHSDPPYRNGRVNLKQCWEDKDRIAFYTIDEGSLIIPYELVKHLTLPGSDTLFLSEATIQKHWFLSLEEDDFLKERDFLEKGDFTLNSKAVDVLPPRSPKDWPLGFVLTDGPRGVWEGKWLGVTCAGCHTGEIEYKDGKDEKGNKFHRIRIDGGPGMPDVNGFLTELRDSLQETLCDGMHKYKDTNPDYVTELKKCPEKKKDGSKFDGGKIDNYAKTIDSKTLPQVLEELVIHTAAHRSWHEANAPKLKHGFGRLDAFGVIYNQLTNLSGTRENRATPDAPVSYPFLWDTSQHDWAQWNAISPRIPKGRNIGQVIGTFGRFNFPPSWGVIGSIPLDKIRTLQQHVNVLRSPAWPEDLLGKIDDQGKVRGRDLYDKKCLHCHAIQERDKPFRRINVHVADAGVTGSLGTDTRMTKTAFDRKTSGAQGPKQISSILLRTVSYVLYHPANSILDWPELFDTALEFATPLFGCTSDMITSSVFPWQWKWPNCYIQDDTKFFYRGRPLDGIWATAPYLHNGSVANLYQLLLPANERMPEFCVGSREFDPVKVGFKTPEKTQKACESGKGYKQGFWFKTGRQEDGNWDRALYGNHNSGHEYGTRKCDKKDTACQTERDREIYDLIEYLKSL